MILPDQSISPTISTMRAILKEAVDRMAAFRASWDDADEVDEVSGLTATDVDIILAQVQFPEAEGHKPVMRELRDG